MKLSFLNLALILPVAILSLSLIIFAVSRSKMPNILKMLRIAAASLCFVLAIAPTLTTYKKGNKNTISVLIDSSDSMFVTKRIDDVKRYLKNNHKELSEKFNLLFFEFSDNFRHIELKDLADIKPSGATDIINSVSNITHAYNKQIDALFLFSDGQQTIQKLSRSGASRKISNVPIYIFDIFENRKIKDIAISEINAPEFAFKDTPISVSVTIGHQGIISDSLAIKIMEDGTTAASKTVQIATDGKTEVMMNINPGKTGKITYTVEIATRPGEITFSNNKQTFQIDVVKEKIRVLYLCGQPSYEYSFLREHLKTDPNVELVSFVILRNPEDIALVPDGELSLIPFPGADILIKELPGFDIVIFENFTYQRFGIYAPHFEMLKKWVNDGGGFLMIGGDNAFGKGGYKNTAVKDILPVIMEDPSETIEEGLFKPQITDYSSPIFSYDDESSKSAWKNLPELDGAQKLAPYPGSTVLIRHPWAKTGKDNIAVLAIRPCGKGRTAALGSNSTWRWKMLSENPSIYDTFWKNLLAYLAGTLEEREMAVIGLKKNITVGKEFSFAVKSGKSGITIKVIITSPDGKKTIPSASKIGPLTKFSFTPITEGDYTVDILYYKGDALLSKETHSIKASEVYGAELISLDVNWNFLKNIADESGGEVVRSDTPIGMISGKIPKRESELKTEFRLNASPLSFLALALLILLELVLRWRIYGLW